MPTIPIILALSVLGLSSVCRAEFGGTAQLPAARVTPAHGIRLDIDYRWVNGNGYRPVTVTLTKTIPANFNRTFRVELRPILEGVYDGVPDIEVSQFLELPPQQNSTTARILVPQRAPWNSIRLKVYEDGVLLPELSSQHLPMINRLWEWSEIVPRLLFIDADAPGRDQRREVSRDPQPWKGNTLPDFRALDVVQVGTSTPRTNHRADWADYDILVNVGNTSNVDLLPPSELPTNWLAYSCFDLAYISWSDLKLLQDRHPERYRALRRWLSTGPLLCVTDLGEEFEALAELEALLGLQPLNDRADRQVRRGWQAPSDDTLGADLNLFDNRQVYRGGPYYQNDRNYYTEPADVVAADSLTLEPGAQAELHTAIRKRPPFVWRGMELGCIAGFASDDPTRRFILGRDANDDQIESLLWQWFFGTIPNRHWQWVSRQSLSQHRINEGYFQWLIPGVGAPPVNTFLVLITVFAVGIGPLNYLFLMRRKRLYLLLVTVPAGAGIVIVGLFVYALFSDGLGVRSRVRSFTHLNQRSGDVVCASRQTFFAGMTPSEGLFYPADCAIFPWEYIPFPNRADLSDLRHLHWEDGQRLRQGYLRSRTYLQLAVTRAATTDRTLQLTKLDDGSMRVENLLGTTIRLLLVGDEGTDKWFMVTSPLAPGASATAKEFPHGDALAQLRRRYEENELREEASMRGRNRPAVRGYANVYGQSGVDSNAVRRPFNTGVMEYGMLVASGLDSGNSPLSGTFNNRGYVAVVDAPPWLPTGTIEARSEAGLHMVRGTW